MRFFLLLYNNTIKNPIESTPLSSRIEDNRNFYLFFKDCIRAIDGTHIPVSLPENEKALFRNRKGYLSQNVLAACDFDIVFTSVLAGWEGSVADSTL